LPAQVPEIQTCPAEHLESSSSHADPVELQTAQPKIDPAVQICDVTQLPPAQIWPLGHFDPKSTQNMPVELQTAQPETAPGEHILATHPTDEQAVPAGQAASLRHWIVCAKQIKGTCKAKNNPAAK
jgi:hypothetical protein